VCHVAVVDCVLSLLKNISQFLLSYFLTFLENYMKEMCSLLNELIHVIPATANKHVGLLAVIGII
jgi:hypothetical protein